MDPKEYAARLQRMQDEIEVAKAREQISNGYNKAMETSPMADTTERLYAEFKAAKKPAAKKKSAAKKESRPVSAARPVLRLEQGDNLGMGEPSPGGSAKLKAYAAEMDSYRASKMRDAGVAPGAGGMAGPDVSPATRAKLRAYAAEGAAAASPVQAAKPTPAEERIKGITAVQAETLLSEIASSRGKHGQFSPEETELISALRERAKGFDYSKAKQAPATPYVPSFLGGKK